MKIILSKQFITDFENEFKKYSINHNDLVLKLKEINIIKLKNPFFKIKTNINWISLRWIWVLNDKESLIPIFLVTKNNKKFWENLILSKEVLEKVNNLFFKYSKDFENWDCLKF